ncbi:hypothetical protein ABT187_49880, partial [Streptomyces sp. NPDC001817]|uniref:hypothetical protein n=1 Tax=Streptomyces sp. NPDC001817 TaxID=3154398 RepID=UPI003325A889
QYGGEYTNPYDHTQYTPARTYTPDGYFTTRDTWQLHNRHQAFNTDPINHTDPSGHMPKRRGHKAAPKQGAASRGNQLREELRVDQSAAGEFNIGRESDPDTAVDQAVNGSTSPAVTPQRINHRNVSPLSETQKNILAQLSPSLKFTDDAVTGAHSLYSAVRAARLKLPRTGESCRVCTVSVLLSVQTGSTVIPIGMPGSWKSQDLAGGESAVVRNANRLRDAARSAYERFLEGGNRDFIIRMSGKGRAHVAPFVFRFTEDGVATNDHSNVWGYLIDAAQNILVGYDPHAKKVIGDWGELGKMYYDYRVLAMPNLLTDL